MALRLSHFSIEKIERKQMKRQLTIDDMQYLALGAALLGSGGGGDTTDEMSMAKYQIEKYGPIDIVNINEIKDDDIIVPVAFMGAPLIAIEKLSSGIEFLEIFKLIEKYLGKKPDYIMPAEIGGGNAFAPLTISGMLKTKVLDADLMGRAFPELQMNSAYLKGVSPAPAFIADSLGNTTIINASDAFKVEMIARNITVAMGSCAALAIYIMTGKQAQNAVIAGSISKAINIGKELCKSDIKNFINNSEAQFIGSGIITDIDQIITNGFLRGNVKIIGKNNIEIQYQNENLAVLVDNKIVATTPDIIIPVDSQTNIPITTESLSFGINVTVLVFKAPDVWQSPEGLELVGPKYFGYDFDYKN